MSCFIQITLLVLILFLSLFVSVHLLFGKALLRSRNQYSGVTTQQGISNKCIDSRKHLSCVRLKELSKISWCFRSHFVSLLEGFQSIPGDSQQNARRSSGGAKSYWKRWVHMHMRFSYPHALSSAHVPKRVRPVRKTGWRETKALWT